MDIDAFFFAPRKARSITPEVVTPPPAVITPAPGQAIVRFLADPAGLKASALNVLNIKIRPVETLTTSTAAELADQRAQAKTILKNIESRRKLHAAPLYDEFVTINAEAKRWTEPVSVWDKKAETVLLAFNRMEADKARRTEDARLTALGAAAEKQAEAESAGDVEAVQAASVEIMKAEAELPAVAPTGYKTDSGTNFHHEEHTFEIVDPSLVPPVYLMPDEQKIRAAVKAGARAIDGVNIFVKESLRVKTR